MSAEAVQMVLARMMREASFAEIVFSHPDEALSGYDLTPAEITNLKAMPRAEFEQVSNGLPEERKSFGIQLNHNETSLWNP
jgi:hypothetical protein